MYLSHDRSDQNLRSIQCYILSYDYAILLSIAEEEHDIEDE